MNPVKRSVGADSVATLLYSSASSVLSIMTGILIARWLGPVGKGVFSGLGLLQSGVAALTGGIGAAITYLLTKKARTIPELISPLAVMLGLVSILTWAGLLAWSALHGYSKTWLIFFICVPASIVLSWQGYIFLGLGRVRVLNRIALARGILLLVVLFVTLRVFSGGVEGSLIAWAVAAYAMALYFVCYALLVGRPERSKHLLQDLTDLIRFGSRSGLDGALGFLNYKIDSLLIIAYLGAGGFGVYSVAVAAGEILYMISRSVATASAHAIGSSDLLVSAQLTAKAVRTTTLIVGAIAIALFIFGPSLIRGLYGGRFDAAALPLRILLPGVVAFASAGIFSSFFSYQLGRPMFGVYLTIMLIAIETIGCVLLVPRWGLVGAAIASTITYFVSTIGETWYFSKVTGMRSSILWVVKREDVRTALNLIRFKGPSRG